MMTVMARISMLCRQRNQPVQMAVRFWIARTVNFRLSKSGIIPPKRVFAVRDRVQCRHYLGIFSASPQCIQVTAFHKMVRSEPRNSGNRFPAPSSSRTARAASRIERLFDCLLMSTRPALPRWLYAIAGRSPHVFRHQITITFSGKDQRKDSNVLYAYQRRTLARETAVRPDAPREFYLCILFHSTVPATAPPPTK